jgi:hypothetical protein
MAARKPAAAKAAPKKQAAKAKAEPVGRGPVTPDAEIVAWAKKEAAAWRKSDRTVTTAGLLRAWREQGGKANPRRFAGLVADVVA